MIYPYQHNLLDNSIIRLAQALKKLTKIGDNQAIKLAYSLAKDSQLSSQLTSILKELKVKPCIFCRLLTTNLDTCMTCTNRKLSTQICVVSNVNDFLTIESTQSYQGKYFITHGCLDFTKGITQETLELDILVGHLQSKDLKVDEVILAFPASYIGVMTTSFIAEICLKNNIKVTSLRYGIPFNRGDFTTISPKSIIKALEDRTVIN